MSVDALLRQVVLALDSAGVPFMLTGSLAAAYHGAGRATMDIDLVIAPSRAQLGSLLDALSATGHYVSRDAAKEALAGQGMFNVIDTTTGWKADLIIRRARTFSETEFARRRPAEYEGCPLWVATVEDVMSATREAGFGPEVKRRIILGTYALSAGYYDAYYGSAQKVRTLIQRDFDQAFAQVDVIATPTAPTTAFKLGEKIDDPLQMYLNDLTTIPANLAGVPGISIPSGLAAEDGLPVGTQFLAPAREDARLYRVGAALEAALVDAWGAPLLEKAPVLGGAR